MTDAQYAVIIRSSISTLVTSISKLQVELEELDMRSGFDRAIAMNHEHRIEIYKDMLAERQQALIELEAGL